MLRTKLTDSEMLEIYHSFAEQVGRAMNPEFRDMLHPENSLVTISKALENLQEVLFPESEIVIKPNPHFPPHKPWMLGNIHMCLDRPLVMPNLPPRTVYSLPPRIESDGSIIATVSQPLAGVTELMWNPGQTVRVKLMGGTLYTRSKVKYYAEEWTRYANIHLDFIDPSEYAEIRVAFDPGGSWSSIGRDALGVPFNYATMNFGWLNDQTLESVFSRVILHEFGHALGLIHEHQSPVGGVQWDREKVYAYFKLNNGWDRAEVDQNVFQKYDVTSTNYSQYDPASIMHYSIPADLTLMEWGHLGIRLSHQMTKIPLSCGTHTPRPQQTQTDYSEQVIHATRLISLFNMALLLVLMLNLIYLQHRE